MMTKTFLAICLLAGCSKSNGDSSPSGKATEAAGGGADVGAINATIPADLKGKIEFEAGSVELRKGRGAKLAVPKGWKAGFMSGSLEPADADNFGSKTWGRTTLRIGSDCNGTCEKKDWAAVSDKVYFSNLAGMKDGKVVKDEKGENRRTMVVERNPSGAFADREVAVHVVVAWWKPDAERYYTCSAELGSPAKGLAAAFEKACSNVAVEE